MRHCLQAAISAATATALPAEAAPRSRTPRIRSSSATELSTASLPAPGTVTKTRSSTPLRQLVNNFVAESPASPADAVCVLYFYLYFYTRS